jgi:hypothetical protein
LNPPKNLEKSYKYPLKNKIKKTRKIKEEKEGEKY